MSTSYLIAANIAVWIGLGGYLLLIARNQKRLDERLRQMEMLRGDGR